MGMLAQAYLKLEIWLVREQDNIFLVRCFEPIRQYGSTISHVETDNFLLFSMTRQIQSYLQVPTIIAYPSLRMHVQAKAITRDFES